MTFKPASHWRTKQPGRWHSNQAHWRTKQSGKHSNQCHTEKPSSMVDDIQTSVTLKNQAAFKPASHWQFFLLAVSCWSIQGVEVVADTGKNLPVVSCYGNNLILALRVDLQQQVIARWEEDQKLVHSTLLTWREREKNNMSTFSSFFTACSFHQKSFNFFPSNSDLKKTANVYVTPHPPSSLTSVQGHIKKFKNPPKCDIITLPVKEGENPAMYDMVM